MDNVHAFHDAIDEAQLISTYYHKEGQDNYLDLNQGSFHVLTENIQAVYDLAKKHARSPGYGEHVAIRQLVCHVNDIDKQRRYWHRPYHVNANEHPELWVRLATLIQE